MHGVAGISAENLEGATVRPVPATKIIARDVNVYYGDKHALKAVDVDIPDRSVTSFIGPSGCGKSTFLRCINRMNDTISICRVTGKIEIDGRDIYDKTLDVVQLRARIGMVFQKPNPFPKSIYRTWPTRRACTEWRATRPSSMLSSRLASKRPAFGTRSRTG